MFKVDGDLTIHVTRGDAGALLIQAAAGEDSYIFQCGNVVRLKVFEKKNCENVVLKKEIKVTEETETVEFALTGENTRIGEVISKPVDYWYEVELNPDTYPQTLIGYDEDGPKVFRVYPEGDGDTKEEKI